jgi:hypothetical protein
MNLKDRVWLIITADHRVRVVRRLPSLRVDEVGVAINLTYPRTRGTVISTLDIEVPDFAPTVELASITPAESGEAA